MSRFKLLLTILLFIPFSVSAACSSSELSRYKSLASNIGNYYDYNGSSFDITLYNVSNELKVINKENNNSYFSSSNFGDVFIGGFPTGSMVRLAVYPINSGCSDYRVSTIYVNLPYFNSYYSDPICANNSSSLCSKWANTSSYTYEQFVSEVSITKIIDEDKPEPEKPVNRYGFFDFLGDYYIFILLFIIIGGSVWIYFLNKKDRFDF